MAELDQHNLEHLSRRSIIPLLPPSFSQRPAVKAALSVDFNQRFLADADTPLDAQVDDLPDLKNVQGDVIHLFPKKAEVFIFFRIADVKAFKTALQTFKVSSSNDVIQFLHTVGFTKRRAQGRKIALIPQSFTQIAFSRMGMNYMNERELTGDPRFDTHAMRDDREFLGDQAQWDKLFDKPHPDPVHGSANNDEGALHGVITIAGSDPDNANQAAATAKAHFGASITIRSDATIDGVARPGDWAGHEHFGYQDGISQPALKGLSKPWPGQIVVDPGVIVMGYKGDPVRDDPYAPVKRPDWAKDGTIMVFRKLEQSVIEFDDYLDKNGRRWREFAPGGASCDLTDKEGAELWGARMVGRWKSGAPVQLCPVRDDPKLAHDNNRNNDFDYHIRNVPNISPEALTDFYCPFIAHTRKTVPRSLDPYIQRQFMDAAMIVRAGLPYGIEVTPEERKAGASDRDKRGLLFVSYQAGLDQGFVRQTTLFGNNDWFPTTSLVPSSHGQDTIIGGPPVKGSASVPTQVQFVGTPAGALPKTGEEVNWTLTSQETGETIAVTGFAGVKPTGAQDPPGVPQDFFVTSRGGEYFFVPSIKTLRMWASDGSTGGLDIMFLLDTAPSMRKTVDQIRSNLQSIVSNVISESGVSSDNVRVGAVAFGEYSQQGPSTQTFGFQQDVAALANDLAALTTHGGDGPKAQSDALNEALNAPWRPSATKIVVLVTGSSPHGIGEVGDSTPQGSPSQRDPLHISDLMTEQGITLNVVTREPLCNEHCPMAHDFYRGITQKTGGTVYALFDDSAITSVASGSIVTAFDIHHQALAYRDYIRGLAKKNTSFDEISKDILDKLTKGQVQLHTFDAGDVYTSDPASDANVAMWFGASKLDEETKKKIKVSGSALKQAYRSPSAQAPAVSLRSQAASLDQVDLIAKAALASK